MSRASSMHMAVARTSLAQVRSGQVISPQLARHGAALEIYPLSFRCLSRFRHPRGCCPVPCSHCRRGCSSFLLLPSIHPIQTQPPNHTPPQPGVPQYVETSKSHTTHTYHTLRPQTVRSVRPVRPSTGVSVSRKREDGREDGVCVSCCFGGREGEAAVGV